MIKIVITSITSMHRNNVGLEFGIFLIFLHVCKYSDATFSISELLKLAIQCNHNYFL